jgi:hypothetical protein
LHKPSRQRGPQFPDAGRDAKALAALASQHLGLPVLLQSFADVGERQLRGSDPVRPSFA